MTCEGVLFQVRAHGSLCIPLRITNIEHFLTLLMMPQLLKKFLLTHCIQICWNYFRNLVCTGYTGLSNLCVIY